MWVKIKPTGDRRFWSVVPLSRASHFGVTLFLTHGHKEYHFSDLSPELHAGLLEGDQSLSGVSASYISLSRPKPVQDHRLKYVYMN